MGELDASGRSLIEGVRFSRRPRQLKWCVSTAAVGGPKKKLASPGDPLGGRGHPPRSSYVSCHVVQPRCLIFKANTKYRCEAELTNPMSRRYCEKGLTSLCFVCFLFLPLFVFF